MCGSYVPKPIDGIKLTGVTTPYQYSQFMQVQGRPLLFQTAQNLKGQALFHMDTLGAPKFISEEVTLDKAPNKPQTMFY